MRVAISLVRSYGHRIVSFLLVALLAFGPAPLGGLVRADEITSFGAAADALLRQNAAASNFGAQTTFDVQPATTNVRRRGILQFNVSAIPPSAAVKTSFVKLFLTTAPAVNHTHAVHRVTPAGPWVESQVTWNERVTGTAWTIAGGDFFANAADSQNTGTTSLTVISWTLLGDSGVSNIPQGWVDGSLTNNGIMVRDVNENTTTGAATYGAKENSNAPRRPVLEVHYLRDVTLNTVTPGISSIQVNFLFPPGATSANYEGTLVAQKPGATPPTFAPADGTAYTVGSQPVSGEWVVSNANNFVASPTSTQFFDENGPDSIIAASTQYSYKFYTRDNNIIPGAAIPPPHFSFGSNATFTTTTAAGGGTNKNWSYKTAGTALAPPGLDPGNVVIAGSNDFNVHSMSPVTGARSYRPTGATGTTAGAIQSRPAVISLGDNQIADCDSVTIGNQPCTVTYVGSSDGRVYAFDASTGQQIWASPAPGSLGALVAVGGSIQGGISVQLKKYANGSFTPTTDLVFVGTRELSATANKVYALNGTTGAIVWTFAPGNMDAVNSTPAVDYANNVIWVASLSNGAGQPSLWKIDSVTGAPIDNFSLGDVSNSPTINGDGRVVYTVLDSGNLVAVRNDLVGCVNTFVTGATSGTGFPIVVGTGNPRDEDIFLTTNSGLNTVHKVNFKYNLSCGGETFANTAGYTDPVGIGTPSGLIIDTTTMGAIYVGSSDGHIYKINAATGAVLANRTVNLGVTIGEPSFDVYLLKLYVGDAQGRVYSFDVF